MTGGKSSRTLSVMTVITTACYKGELQTSLHSAKRQAEAYIALGAVQRAGKKVFRNRMMLQRHNQVRLVTTVYAYEIRCLH